MPPDRQFRDRARAPIVARELDAPRVVVLELGRIIESGAHDELVASSGVYRRLCALQMLV